MSDENAVQVNFGKAMPLFPLDAVTLLPQQVLPLHVFEPRYRQMVERVIDGSGQIAMGIFDGREWKQQYHGRPRIKPAVCVGHIVQHERLSDGKYNILLQGVCRARILKELPAVDDKLFREVMIEPVGVDGDSVDLEEVRDEIEQSLAQGPLTQMTVAEPLLEYLRNPQYPTYVLLELISFTLVTSPRLRYLLLAEGNVNERAKVILDELHDLQTLVKRAAAHKPGDLPKGCNWN